MLALMWGKGGEELMLGDEQRRVHILEHEGDALGGIGGIEGDVRGSGLQDAQHSDEHVEGAWMADADEHVGCGAVCPRKCASWFARALSWA